MKTPNGPFEQELLRLIRREGRVGAADLVTMVLPFRSYRRVPPSQIYPALTRLVDAGLIKAETVGPEPRQGGRRRRLFSPQESA